MRTAHGFMSRQPRFTAQIRWARSDGQSSSAVRPLGNATVAVCNQSGRLAGTRFWKNISPVAPSGKRFITVGRRNTPRSAPSPTSR